MAKREYTGPAIDMTDTTHLAEIDDQTIAGSSADDTFEEITKLLPDDVDPEKITDKEKKIIHAYLTQRPDDDSIRDLAHGHDEFSREHCRRTVHKIFRDTREFEDLSDGIQLAIKILAFEGVDADRAYLEDKYPVSRRTISEASKNYPDLVEQYSDITESELETTVQEYRATHGSSDGGDSHRGEQPTSVEERTYPSDYSETYEWFIETISDNPSLSSNNVAKRMPREKDWSRANYYNVVKSHSDVIKQRVLEKGTAQSKDDFHEYLQDHLDLSEFESAERTPDRPSESDSQTTSNNNPEMPENVNSRLDDLESQVDALSEKVESNTTSEDTNKEQLAQLIVNSLSDDELGKLIKKQFSG